MINMSIIVWWFPILFILHEMEEIIVIKPWKEAIKNRNEVIRKFMPYKDFLSTESFSVAVFEELIIIIAITIHAWVFDTYYIWMGLFIAVTIHHLFHIIMCFVFKGFVPGVISSTIILFGSAFLIRYTVFGLSLDILKVIIWSVAMVIIFFINLMVLHQLMPWFEKILKKG